MTGSPPPKTSAEAAVPLPTSPGTTSSGEKEVTTDTPVHTAPSSPAFAEQKQAVGDPATRDFITPASESAPPQAATSTGAQDEKAGSQRPAVTRRRTTSIGEVEYHDPLDLGSSKRPDVTSRQLKIEHPQANKRKLKKFYTRQNELIDQFLMSGDEERLAAKDMEKNGPKIKFAINASSAVNLCLFVIQLYAAITTGSLSLFATAADAFMDLVSSITMLVTSRMAARPSIYKYPVGRTRIETIGIILFCALMTTVAVQLIVESGRALGAGEKESEPLKLVPLVCVGVAIGAKSCLMVYCFLLRRYPAAHVFFIDHRNDIVVNSFGLIMSIIGTKVVWWLDPFGAIAIGMLILVSWVSEAFEQVWLLVGKSAPKEFLSKVIYMTVTHDDQIRKVDTCRAYHAGQKYYVEVDVIMDEDCPLKISHDVSQELQRKIEGLEAVERAFVHVDYEHDHDVNEEHKPLYGAQKKRKSLKEMILAGRKKIDDMLP